jgi:hypothetical protein
MSQIKMVRYLQLNDEGQCTRLPSDPNERDPTETVRSQFKDPVPVLICTPHD